MSKFLYQGLIRNIFLFTYISISLSRADSSPWSEFESIIQDRVHQTSPKMRLQAIDAIEFKRFLNDLHDPTPELKSLKAVMPKTTLELLMAVNQRGLDLKEAEVMAAYLKKIVKFFHFTNPAAFDENTSHIIGRDWPEIDYSGENMTWQGQQAKYKPYGIENFKTLKCLKKFFPVESKLPYFKETYHPQNLEDLSEEE